MSKLRYVLATALGCFCANGVLASSQSDIEKRFDRVNAVWNETARAPMEVQDRRIAEEFKKQLGAAYAPRSLTRASTSDLGILVRAAELAESYSTSHDDVDKIKVVIEELARRKALTSDHLTSYYKALISVRDFDTAKLLVSSHPGTKLDPVPKIVAAPMVPGRPSFYEVDSKSFTLTKKSIDLSTGTHLIVVAHSLCHFSQEAMTTLAQDEQLLPIIRKHGLWLAPVDRSIYFEELQTWNIEHPATQIVIADKKADWPFINSWATPTFYLLRDGQLVGSISGWEPKVGNRVKLVALLKEGGLLPH